MTTTNSPSFAVELSSVPDRDGVVAEVWLGQVLLAQLHHEDGVVRVQFYPMPSGHIWELSYDDLIAALITARTRLGSPDQSK